MKEESFSLTNYSPKIREMVDSTLDSLKNSILLCYLALQAAYTPAVQRKWTVVFLRNM